MGHTPAMKIERLPVDAWERLRSVRLAALAQAPEAFGSTYAGCVLWEPGQWREQLETIATFIAVIDGADVGMVRGVESERSDAAVYLISMWVAPEARRRGVGGALIAAVIGWARGLGKAEVLLHARDYNSAAIALYEREGFRATGEVVVEPAPEQHLRELEFRRSLLP